MVTIPAGCAARSVTSGAQVALLSADGGTTFPAAGIALVNTSRWTLTVTTTQDVTVRVFVAAGANAGLVILSAATTVVTSAASLVLSQDAESGQRIYVTAQATGATAAVSADFRGVSP